MEVALGTFKDLPTPAGSVGSTPSSKDLDGLKREVGRVAGAADDPDEVGAQVAIEHALTRIFETPWDYYLSMNQITTVAGTGDYSLPANVRTVQIVRVSSGNERVLRPVRYDQYSLKVPNQTSNSDPTHYTLQGIGQNNITLLPTPVSEETVDVWYFREPAWPNNGRDLIDLPKFLEMPLIMLAKAYVAINTETVPASKLQAIVAMGEDALKGARGRDRSWFDEDVGFMPNDGQTQYPWDHPDAGRSD